MPRRYWLMKCEPAAYTIDDLARDGETSWEGVRNYQARNLMRDQMRVGDGVLFYASNADPSGVTGLATVSKPAYPDHFAWKKGHKYFNDRGSKASPVWYMVDIAFAEDIPPEWHEVARAAGSTFVHDVGIAPGLSNMLIAAASKEMGSLTKATIRVGGNPAEPDDDWSYMAPFSPTDVLEEYTRPARVFRDGQVVTKPALSDRHLFEVEGRGEMEAFRTDGLRSLLTSGLSDQMDEFTVRWPGHIDRYLQDVEAGELDEEALLEAWRGDPAPQDFTWMDVVAESRSGERARWVFDMGVLHGRSSMTTATGTVTLTSTQDLFTDDHVDGLFLLEEDTSDDYSMWEPAKTYTASAKVRWENNVYQCVTGGTSGAVAPVHIEGNRWDGQASASCRWEYLHSGYGICVITAVASATSATALVLKRMPDAVVSQATPNWREGAWSPHQGWPRAVALFEQRIWWGGTDLYPQTLWSSVGGDFTDYQPGDLDDDAIDWTINSRQANPISALVDGTNLHVLCEDTELIGRASNNSAAVSPGDFTVRRSTSYGTAPVRPLTIDIYTIIVDASGRRLVELGFDAAEDNFVPFDMTLYAEHITRPGQ